MKRPPPPADRRRIYLSPPHMSGAEEAMVAEAFSSNWIAPLGPHVDAFEEEFAQAVGASHAVALSSGTAALHLALILAGVEHGDEVLVSTFTFSASVNPIRYLGAVPVFIDSEAHSWNLDPVLLDATLKRRAKSGSLPAAVVAVHLYGQSANLAAISEICRTYGVPLVEDAAEALGSSYEGSHPGTWGQSGIFSFNGNKIITTSGGGMLVTENGELAAHARKLATQARDSAPHYQHSEIGYNYRLSNVLAGIGRAQLRVLEDRVQARRKIFERYRELLAPLPGLEFQAEAGWGRHNRWLTCLLVDSERFGADREALRQALEAEDIEARPLWKPMHRQPIFEEFEVVGGQVADDLFRRGLCLPSGSAMSGEDIDRVVSVIRSVHESRHELTARTGAAAPT
jgi:dTDP-4-amino-4,6-dideoxygalactose transaminase